MFSFAVWLDTRTKSTVDNFEAKVPESTREQVRVSKPSVNLIFQALVVQKVDSNINASVLSHRELRIAKVTLLSKDHQFDHKHQPDMRSGQISAQNVKMHITSC